MYIYIKKMQLAMKDLLKKVFSNKMEMRQLWFF